VSSAALRLLAALVLLIPLQKLLHSHLQGVLYLLTRKASIALGLYAILFLPGVVLHEGSHYLAAIVLRVKTHGFSLMPRRVGQMVRFGYVEVEGTDPVRASLIGLAPLFAGTVAVLVLALGQLGLGELASSALAMDWSGARDSFGRMLATPDFALWLYLVFAISNTMFPSRSDRAAWLPAALLVGLIGLGLWMGGLDGWIQGGLLPLAESGAVQLSVAFAVTAGLDALLLVPVLLLEAVLTRLLGVQIAY
jgi:hypothetical protein